jgi:hypothetical protein
MNGGDKEFIQNLVKNPQGKTTGRPKCRWKNNIKMDFRVTGVGDTD